MNTSPKFLVRAALSGLAALAFAGTASAATNLIVDGSFESVKQANGTWHIYDTLAGWQVGPKGVEVRDNVAGTAYAGKNFVELDTTANSWIAQTFQTTVGQSYELSFFYSGRPGVSAASNTIDAYIDGTLAVVADSSGIGQSNNVWKDYTKTFVATSSFTTLVFAAAGVSDSYGGSLDKVVVTSVPEPTSTSLLVAGLGMIALIARRRAS